MRTMLSTVREITLPYNGTMLSTVREITLPYNENHVVHCKGNNAYQKRITLELNL
jgi:hypothetical protein